MELLSSISNFFAHELVLRATSSWASNMKYVSYHSESFIIRCPLNHFLPMPSAYFSKLLTLRWTPDCQSSERRFMCFFNRKNGHLAILHIFCSVTLSTTQETITFWARLGGIQQKLLEMSNEWSWYTGIQICLVDASFWVSQSPWHCGIEYIATSTFRLVLSIWRSFSVRILGWNILRAKGDAKFDESHRPCRLKHLKILHCEYLPLFFSMNVHQHQSTQISWIWFFPPVFALSGGHVPRHTTFTS